MNLYSAHKKQDNDDEKNKTDATAWVIAPATAVWPCGQRPESHQEQDHKKNSQHDLFGPLRFELFKKACKGISGLLSSTHIELRNRSSDHQGEAVIGKVRTVIRLSI